MLLSRKGASRKRRSCSPTFDGHLWFVAFRDELYAIDATSDDFDAVWRVPEIGGEVTEIARSAKKLMLVVATPQGFEKWWYDLPQLVLRSRNPQPKWLQMDHENQTFRAASAFVAYSVVLTAEAGERGRFEARVYDYETETARFALDEATRDVGRPHLVEKHFALASLTDEATRVALYEVPRRLIAEFVLDGAAEARVRLDERYLTATDEHGRVLVYDLRERLLRRNLRL